MILSDLFQGAQFKNTNTQRTNTAKANALSTGKQTESSTSNAHLQTLKPGQMLQGEVVAKDGNQVQIRLEDDTVVEAKVDQDMNLQTGKTMTFEVRGNGQNLTLSPLFENTATQANALKALEMASIPANQTTVSMTGLMMEAGLPVDRNSLQQMFREVNGFQGAGLANIVDLHKLGIAVNEQNLTQIASYKNFTHQLVEGMHTVLDAMPEAMENMLTEGNVDGAARMFEDLLQMMGELPQEANVQETDAQEAADTQAAADNVQGEPLVQDGRTMAADTLSGTDGKIIFSENGSGSENISEGKEMLQPADLTQEASAETLQDRQDVTNAGEKLLTAAQNLDQELMHLVQNTAEGDPSYMAIAERFSDALQNGTVEEQAKALQQMVHQGLQDKNSAFLEGLLANKGAQKFLAEGMAKLWTIEPKDVAEPGKVDELYSRLNRQLNHLHHMLEENGQQQSSAWKAVSNMSQNIDFLQQLNQAYTYVQLPLRLQQGDAHGDLYVYTNKRNLAARDGQISALLHLDMDHLGPVDVYVAMQAERVSTRFYVQDDEMLDFLEQHMDVLNERLQKRGYNCTFSMQTRDENARTESGLNGLLDGENGQQTKSIAQYAFDVRA